MDNAAKAIIIAGTILVSVLVISLGVYMLTTFRSFYETNTEALRAREIADFNSFFESYPNEGTVKGYEAYSIYNKCRDLSNNLDSSFTADCRFIDKERGNVADSNSSVSNETQDTIVLDSVDKTFFYTENLDKNFEYKYEYDSEGVINKITLTLVTTP
jgi:hypothetical protein